MFDQFSDKPRYTDWINPTRHTLKLDICVEANGKPKSDRRAVIHIPPSGTKLTEEQRRTNMFNVDAKGCMVSVRLPSSLDHAIHELRDGVIVGGLAPQLRRAEGESPMLAPALDPEAEKRKAAAEREEAARAEAARLKEEADTAAAQRANADREAAAAAKREADAKAKAEAESKKGKSGE
jgi:hypothetical protein